MKSDDLRKLIVESKYYTKYEPILHKDTEEVFGYEALSKFVLNDKQINTEEMFRNLHDNKKLFFELEKRNKQFQIENFPFKSKLFLNFNADIVVTDSQKDYWLDLLNKYNDFVVVEITKNSTDNDITPEFMRGFANWLDTNHIDSALDDFTQEGSMFSFYIMNRCKYIKIDKTFLEQIRKNKNYIPYLNGILETIRLNNQKSIVEGIETIDDLNLVKSLKCDFMQGYYFNDLVKTI